MDFYPFSGPLPQQTGDQKDELTLEHSETIFFFCLFSAHNILLSGSQREGHE